MARPHVVVYNEVSVDGRVVGFSMDAGRYYARGFRWASDAILMGSVTAQAFGPAEPGADQARELPPPERLPVLPGFEHLVSEPRPLLVVPDSRGTVRNWVHALEQPWYRGVVVLVSEATPPDYLDYLGRRGIEHLVAGDDRVDLAAALDVLAARHAVRSVRTDSGGALNGALLAAGLVDELALILHPAVSGDPRGQRFVRLPRPLGAEGVPLTLLELERLDDGALWLRYAVGTPSDHPAWRVPPV
jgi:2,5-diamino-6-(ribosylamino)-4(3H)-pyrimidinone 5'-phosphate reductase